MQILKISSLLLFSGILCSFNLHSAYANDEFGAPSAKEVLEATPQLNSEHKDNNSLEPNTRSKNQSKELIVERSFTITKVKVPKECELKQYKLICTRLINYYVRRFERDMVSHLNEQYDKDTLDKNDGFLGSAHRVKSIQNITLSLYSKKGDDIMTLFSIFKQKIAGQEEENLLVETFNMDIQTNRLIEFEDLFANPKLAAMLCARNIEARYLKYNSPLLQVVISATELKPSNFIVTDNGIRFFFAPGLLKPNSTTADSIFIHLEVLKSALPIDKWWSKPKASITQEQKDALAKSALSKVINLDEDIKVSEAISKARDKAKAQKEKQNHNGGKQDE